MHLARHTSRPELRRVAGIDAAAQAPRHADLNTTLGIYGHRDQNVETAMDAYASWLEQQRENEIIPPKLTAESALLSRKVEAAGIEPAQDFNRRAE